MRVLILMSLILISISCRKQIIKEGEKRLPKETSKGKGIFACYIDENTYIFKKQNEIIYNSTTGYLALNILGRFGKEFRLFVYEGVFGIGDYQFDLTEEEYIPTTTSNSLGISSTGINQITIKTLDTELKIISGTFNFDLIDDNSNIIKIRDGRFDLKLKIIS